MNGHTDLLAVFAVSRHGIRSQTPALATMNLFTQRPQGFPLWPAPADVSWHAADARHGRDGPALEVAKERALLVEEQDAQVDRGVFMGEIPPVRIHIETVESTER